MLTDIRKCIDLVNLFILIVEEISKKPQMEKMNNLVRLIYNFIELKEFEVKVLWDAQQALK